jgi:hypothetical protein
MRSLSPWPPVLAPLSLSPGTSGFDLPDLAAHRDEVVENFVNQAKRLISLGAE